ncbi:MAG: hypothetical protein SangKO_099100 [Sandaracinaceae bacterium]
MRPSPHPRRLRLSPIGGDAPQGQRGILARAILLAVALALPTSAQSIHPGLHGADLRAALRGDLASTATLGYGPARDSLYTYEQRTSGAVCGIYTAFCITLQPRRDASTSAFEQGINAEHTWPQSRGTASGPQRSDLHGLFPARANVNSSRGNHPYAEIPDSQATAWYRLDASQSNTPAVFLDQWSERANGYPGTPYAARFEPREDRSGDVARAIAYIATLYEASIDAEGERTFLTTMRPDLVAWNMQDPPDARELDRATYIASLQGHGNPFLDDPTLLPRALADYGPTGGPDTITASTDLWVNEIHYDNAGTDTGEFIELAGRAGLDLAGWRLVFYNGNGGAVYDDRTLSGILPDESLGIGTTLLPYPTNGIQNGPDAIALVTPLDSVAQFLSYEGPVVATEGPASGLTSTDIGVEEAGSTPTGHSLQLVGSGRASADFAWTGPGLASLGTLNAGQSVAVPVANSSPTRSSGLHLTLSPNPASGTATATLTSKQPLSVRATVYDALGREVLVAHRQLVGGIVSIPLDMSRLPPGLYLLRVTAVGESSAMPQGVRFTVVR